MHMHERTKLILSGAQVSYPLLIVLVLARDKHAISCRKESVTNQIEQS